MTDITRLADELLEIMFDANPIQPALLGLDGTRPGLGDISEEDERRTADRMRDVLDRALSFEDEQLDATDRVTRDVVIHHARTTVDSIEVADAEFTVTDMFVAPASRLLTLLPLLTLGDGDAARTYLDRLARIPAYLDAALDRHRAGVRSGRTPVRHLVDAAIEHIDRYLADEAADPLLRPATGQPDGDFDAERDRLLAEVVRPAFARYREGLASEIAEHARPAERPGLCWLPGGEEIYRTLARVHTTTDRAPEELHRTGLSLIEQLAGEYSEIGSRAFGTRDLGTIFHRLRSDPSLQWGSAEELLAHARSAIERAEQEAPRWFGSIPPQPWEVREVPAAQAPGAPAAYYMQPAADGSRPGIYFANTHQATERFRHISEATAFHEVIPGHHFQLSTAQRLTHLPLLRTVAGVTAYIEGWGLYTERLADEMGLYSDDIALLGMLVNDSMRAGRLVVDTGLHALGWSRQQAIDYLAEHTPMPLVEISSEIDRYIAYPGQALAYMVGRLELQRIRADAERTLGDGFDIRAFHDTVLGCGSVPLSVLQDVVGQWCSVRA
ncbi:DUF885 domain-containing protein [Haloechinothrix sp. LS1_15]|uniref:DUF885 domain-containing protein n=1 Tax=Haloechinothrix sp. LS1_15 TaxID=2652248 RepID=UPI00294411EA|nr:DUF885 domain-containing protein [Haloechinothrix sp. LS1_15]MDV6013454.1 DUF885 domain-containing protein [Haloechinothrix sp. LS1_15]